MRLADTLTDDLLLGSNIEGAKGCLLRFLAGHTKRGLGSCLDEMREGNSTMFAAEGEAGEDGGREWVDA